MKIKNKFAAALLTLSASIGMGAIVSASTLRVVQTPTLHLYAGQSASATTMRITPFPKDLDGTKLTIVDLGTNPTVTVDPKISGIEEIESFTGITDNGDGTATLTGISRNLVSKFPYITAGTGRNHGAGATVVFGNNPQIYGRMAAWENQGTTTAEWDFGTTTSLMPRYYTDPGAAAFTTAPSTVFVSMDQLTRTALAGVTNATRFVQGALQVAFRGQAASSTPIGSTGAFAVLTTDIATSSPSIVMSTSSVVMTRLDSRIAPSFMSTSTADTYTLGNLIVNATTTLSGSTTIAANATNKLTLNSLPYTFPSVRAASSTYAAQDASGNVTFEPLLVSTADVVGNPFTSSAAASTSARQIVIPGGTFGSTTAIRIKAYGNYNQSSGLPGAEIIFGTGAASSTIANVSGCSTSSANGCSFIFSVDVFFTGPSTQSAFTVTATSTVTGSLPPAPVSSRPINQFESLANTTFSTAGNLYLNFIVNPAANTAQYTGIEVETLSH